MDNLNSLRAFVNRPRHVHQSPAGSDVEQAFDSAYAITDASQIGAMLRELEWHQCKSTLSLGDETEVACTVSEVDVRRHTFMLVVDRSKMTRCAMATAGKMEFRAYLRRVPVIFVIDALQEISAPGEGTIGLRFPTVLYYPQRRRNFRAPIGNARTYTCDVPLSARGSARMEIVDISLSGLGMRSKFVSAEHVPEGFVGRRIVLDFGAIGKATVDFKVVGLWSKEDRGQRYQHLGCAFFDVGPETEKQLQRIVFALEVAASPPRD